MGKTIEEQIIEAEKVLRDLRSKQCESKSEPQTVIVPEQLEEVFHTVEKKVFNYFNGIHLTRYWKYNFTGNGYERREYK